MESNQTDRSEKLQKIIAACGVCSRRRAEELITQGVVTVNGTVAKLGDRADFQADKIEVEGKLLEKAGAHTYIMLNKPLGYVTTMSDEHGRKTVAQLIADVGTRVYPIGRLDMYSQGLLLMTDDGDLANGLTHPKHEIYKEYVVRVGCGQEQDPEQLLIKPMEVDGYKIAQPIVKNLEKTKDGFLVSIKIREGRNRQIRKMCENCGFTVLNLTRVSVGDLKLERLSVGKWRHLTPDEVENLKASLVKDQDGGIN